MLGRQRRAAELVGEQDAAGCQSFQWQVLDVPIARGAGEVAAVEPVRPEEPGLRLDRELIEQRCQIDAAPSDIGHAARRHVRLQRIADALMHRLHHCLGTRLEVVESEDLGAANQPVDGQRPLCGVDAGNAEMGKHEQIFRRGQRTRHFVRAQRHATNADGGFHRRSVWGGMGERCTGHGNRDLHRVGRSRPHVGPREETRNRSRRRPALQILHQCLRCGETAMPFRIWVI